MPHILEIKGGELLTPMGLYDAMEAVEEYMGTDIRQYLEDYFTDYEDCRKDAETASEEVERVEEHYHDVLSALEIKLSAIERGINMSRINKKEIREDIAAMRKMLEREM